MKYESSILKRLVDTYGVVGNPRYISEVIKEFIVRGKERFPELFTYQADWLAHIDEFGLNPTYTVSYTGQSIYAPNTLERPVKSAILKGQTLVNLVVNSNIEKTVGKSSGTEAKYDYIQPLENNKEYTVQFEISNFNAIQPMTCSFDNGWNVINDITIDKNGIYKTKFTIMNRESTQIWFYWPIPQWDDGNSATVKNIIVLEGDHTQKDIPYFEGMQSVKMPVLTTTGKNLFNYQGKELSCYYSANLEGKYTANIKVDSYCVEVLPNTTYTLSCENKASISHLTFWDKNKIFIDGEKEFVDILNRTFTTPSNCKYIKFPIHKEGVTNVQLEQGSTPTTYEPYKTNILTANEDVTLRGIGDVQDTLDCLTGEVTERIGEIVLDGSEDWRLNNSNTGTNTIIPYLDNYFTKQTKIIMAEFPRYSSSSIWHGNIVDYECYLDNTETIAIRINKDKLVTADINGFKQWLSQNPITVQYQLATESIKTVDLTILDQNGQNVKQLMSFNGGTHFNTTSLEGSPLPVVSVSVETDLEEILMMCSLEGNTL